jgi:alpha-acetolactate decarboxylase
LRASGRLNGTASLDHPGYHFHFLSADHGCGGHLIDGATGPLRLRLEAIDDLHLALPRTPTPHPAKSGQPTPAAPWATRQSIEHLRE